MAEAIETLAARLNEAMAVIQRFETRVQAQQSQIAALQAESGSSRLLAERTMAFNERMAEAIEKLGEKGPAVDQKRVGKPFTFS